MPTLDRTCAAPITYRGTPLRAAKQFLAGTHRCVSPEETWDHLRPHLRRAGITRIADISGLDRVGVTTAIAVRPNARTLATSAGKGFTRIAAVVSAAMESIELHHAEFPRLDVTVATFDDLRRSEAVIEAERLPLSKYSLFKPRRPDCWIRGWELMQERETYLPFISAAMIRPPAQQPGLEMSMPMTSNGLAGGNHLLEAACAALYEVIERDAVTCHRAAETTLRYRAPLVPLDDRDFPLVRDLVGRFRACGMRVVARDYTVDTEVPVYQASLFDERTQGNGIFGGWGAHLDPEIALVRALTEAAQSRVVYISGSRDDIFRHEERQARYNHNPATVAANTAPGHEPAPARISESGASFEADLRTLLTKLGRVGIRQVLLVDLTRDDFQIPVARVVVPGLEGYLGPDYVAGERAQAFVDRVGRSPRATTERQ